MSPFALQWRHDEHNGVLNHQPHDCLLNRLFSRISSKTSKLRVTVLCAGNLTGEFPAQRASNSENVSVWWRHPGHQLNDNKYWLVVLSIMRNTSRLYLNIAANYLPWLAILVQIHICKSLVAIQYSVVHNVWPSKFSKHYLINIHGRILLRLLPSTLIVWFNTLRPGQNGCLFPDIFKRISFNKNFWISITISP